MLIGGNNTIQCINITCYQKRFIDFIHSKIVVLTLSSPHIFRCRGQAVILKFVEICVTHQVASFSGESFTTLYQGIYSCCFIYKDNDKEIKYKHKKGHYAVKESTDQPGFDFGSSVSVLN